MSPSESMPRKWWTRKRPRAGQAATRAFFGATVRYANAAGTERVMSIVGTDEVDLNRNHVSWMSPLGRAILRVGASLRSRRDARLLVPYRGKAALSGSPTI